LSKGNLELKTAMNIPVDRIIEELSRPEAYPEPVPSVQVIQTHISIIFLAGPLVYKVKKPVDFGFLDFTTLEKRHHFCNEELTLNRRLSPDLYIDVIPVTEVDGLLRFGGTGTPVEYAVLMKRLDEDRLLSSLLDRGEATGEMVERIAERIADFHRSAQTSEEITEVGGSAAVEFNTEENFQQIEPYISRTLSREVFDLIAGYTRTFREANEGLLRKREEGGWIRDGHGDLHTQHVCMNEDIQIIDCIEFNRRFRFADVLSDASFLAMDLQMRGYPDLADRYTRAYLSGTGQQGTEALYNFYACYHAVARGKVEGFRSDDPNITDEEAQSAAESARGFFKLAERFARTLHPATLLVTCGLMGSGKSSLAEGLSDRIEMEVISTDRVRKELAGIDPAVSRHAGFREDIYSRQFTDRTYGELFSRADRLLTEGRTVLLDGTFTDPVRRNQALKVARDTGARFLVLYLEAEEEILRSRLRERAGKVTITNGREEILADQMRAFIPPEDVPAGSVLIIDASGSHQEIIRSAYRRVLSTNG
jgi:aminoglycoside phosphotransferase family enzyme/predicted kinase